MTRNAQDFHNHRRAFMIMPDTGLWLAPENTDISHEKMLKNLGLSQDDILKFLTVYPRGYFMDGELCIYQGYDMTPGVKWELVADGRKMAQQYLADLRALFALNDDTPVYLGVIVGQIGEVWKKINKTHLKRLEKSNIVM